MNKAFLTLTIIAMATISSLAQIPPSWTQFTVEDTINIPIDRYWDLSLALKLEEIGSVSKYKNLPSIIKTTPVVGEFNKVGDSRRVHFNNGKTLLETIIIFEKPNTFGYELTELEIDLKKVARKARGLFKYEPIGNGSTKITWTYGFDQKNLITKWLINSYIKSTHRYWMKDTLAEMIRQSKLNIK